MPAHLTFSREKAASILGARRVGAKQRDAAAQAGVPPRTLDHWLATGRAYNESTGSERNPSHADLGAFAEEWERASAQYRAVLHQRVMKATEQDGRLAFDVLRWNSLAEERRLKRKLLAAQAEVERHRADGTHVENVRQVESMTDDELDRRIAELERATH